MAVQSSAAPPTPWSKSLAQPKINESAYVHSFSNVIGDVHIGSNVLISPGTSIRADEGGPFHVGAGSNVQDGVVIHGLEQGRVIGDDQEQYSVWIGKNTSVTHMALIHGPAYIGDDCFIGFRSTVFNARVGRGSIVMMHVLLQDIEIPPGKYVPSGSIITTQQQADRLPDVQSVDVKFATHVVGITDALRSGAPPAEEVIPVTPIHSEIEKASNVFSSSPPSQNSSQMHNTHLDSEVIAQIRQLLAQGHRIATEHADTRRFQTSSWQSCAPIQTNRESEVLAALENCLAEHRGEYVRLFGIDTKSRRRVSEMTIQRPGNQEGGRSPSTAFAGSQATTHAAPEYSSSSSHAQGGEVAFSPEVVEQVRQLLKQGYRLGTEHADTRRFQTSSWQTCSPIQATRESEALAALKVCLAEHSGEYVRLFGIDTQLKRRLSEMIVQRPGGRTVAPLHNIPSVAPDPKASRQGGYTNGHATPTASARLGSEVVNQIRQLLAQGHRIAAEHADARRFQTSSWRTCASIQSTRESEVIAAIESCMAENSGEYVRVYGIDTQSKRRVSETIVQRP